MVGNLGEVLRWPTFRRPGSTDIKSDNFSVSWKVVIKKRVNELNRVVRGEYF